MSAWLWPFSRRRKPRPPTALDRRIAEAGAAIIDARSALDEIERGRRAPSGDPLADVLRGVRAPKKGAS